MASGTNDTAHELVHDGEERWATARRVASDDHPKDCPCIRDHLENAFLIGMVEGEEREHPSLSTRVEELERLNADLVGALSDLLSAGIFVDGGNFRCGFCGRQGGDDHDPLFVCSVAETTIDKARGIGQRLDVKA